MGTSWRASCPRWLCLRRDSLPMITLFLSQGDFCATAVPLFAPLLALPLPEHHYPLLNLSPQRQRQKTLETLVAILLELAEHQPVLLIIEDLHWTDPTTLELLHLVID